jgi:lantibiotic modifying enzyme
MRSEFLPPAEALAHRIAASAVWWDGRCTWIGALGDERGSASGRPAVASLGADLYEGTAGVALFLAEAGATLGDARLAATALGAIRHAQDGADRAADGLHGGRLGIIHAAGRVAALLGAEDVAARARTQLRAWRSGEPRAGAPEVLAGRAGAVIGLLALDPVLGAPWQLKAATAIGDTLIRSAERDAAGWSWAAPAQRRMRNLCGYAHGVSGIGHAFTELFGATGEARFREAAERAFAYERSWLDAESGAWADLRGIARSAGRHPPVPSADSWCNGAAGIAVSRLRASEVLGSPPIRHDAERALAACERHVSGLLERVPEDFSLCHGVAGAADALLLGEREQLAVQVGRCGIELLGRSGLPCGVPEGETPALMLGLAGVGLFYLRLVDPGVPSALLLRARLA